MLYFKRLIQIPRLPEVPVIFPRLPLGCSLVPTLGTWGTPGACWGPTWALGTTERVFPRAVSSSHSLPLPQGPPNFLRASALAEHIKPVVVIPEEAPEDEEPENLIEISTGPPAGEPAVRFPLLVGCPSARALPWPAGPGGVALGHRACVAGGGRPL